MCVELVRAKKEDMEDIWKMQLEAFAGLLEKYHDYDASPGAESFDKVMTRFEQPWTTYYYIVVDSERVGAVRIIDKKDGHRKRISPLWIMPEYRNKGYAQQALRDGRGVVILKDGKIVSGASSYTRYREGIEIEVDTVLEERRKHMALISCSELILQCLEEGLYPSWDAQNINSVRLAEKLGYKFDHEYVVYEVG